MIINYSILEIEPHEFWSMTEVKNYLRISGDYDDNLLQEIIKSAVDFAENFTGLNFYKKIILAKVNAAQERFRLKYSYMQEIIAVTYANGEDMDDVSETYGSFDKYTNEIRLNKIFINKRIEIKYKSGYKDTAIPSLIKQGLLTHIAAIYEESDLDPLLNAKIHAFYAPYRLPKI